MLSYSPYMLVMVAALLVTCHALRKCSGIPGLPGIPGRDGLKGQPHLPGKAFLEDMVFLDRNVRKEKNWILDHHVKKDDVHVMFCLHDSLDIELHHGLANLKHRLSRLEGVLALNGKIKEAGEKILASNGKKVDFLSALESCEEAGGTLATPMNEEENKAILGIVKQYNQYAYLGIKEGETSGQFKYINGTPLSYTKWHQYEPNGKGTEKCVEMYTDGSWNDKRCNVYRLTICEF